MFDLSTLGLTPEQVEARKGKFNASNARILMEGSDDELLQLWEEMTGRRKPKDLSDVLPVVMGSYTEPLNIAWFNKQTGRKISDIGKSLSNPDYPWLGATLDACTVDEQGRPCPLECKHVNAFSKIQEVIQKYYWQMTAQMVAGGYESCTLSVFIGTLKWEYTVIDLDIFHAGLLTDKAKWFMECVENDVRPVQTSVVEAPALTPITEWREVDLTGNNEFAALAADWLENRLAAKKFDEVTKALKGLVEDDVGRVFGHGIEITRAKNRSLTIRELKEKKGKAA